MRPSHLQSLPQSQIQTQSGTKPGTQPSQQDPTARHGSPGRALGEDPVARARREHPAAQVTSVRPGRAQADARSRGGGEDGSLITEYGLLAIVAATVAGAVISWASGGAMSELFDALMDQARGIVGV